MPVVVKRKGHKERFDEKKTYGSVYAACASAQYSREKCERISEKITKKVKKFTKGKKEVTATKIHDKILYELKKIAKELKFFYEHHIPDLKKL